MNRDNQGRFARGKRIISVLLKKAAFLSVFALVAIIGWEQYDDRVEQKWHDLTVSEYVAASTTQVVTSDEQKLIEKYKDSDEAQGLIEAWAKGKAADDMRERAEQLSQDARAVSLGFTRTVEQ